MRQFQTVLDEILEHEGLAVFAGGYISAYNNLRVHSCTLQNKVIIKPAGDTNLREAEVKATSDATRVEDAWECSGKKYVHTRSYGQHVSAQSYTHLNQMHVR
jgi:hypothetical protein